jgi:hypothetical protein
MKLAVHHIAECFRDVKRVLPTEGPAAVGNIIGSTLEEAPEWMPDELRPERLPLYDQAIRDMFTDRRPPSYPAGVSHGWGYKAFLAGVTFLADDWLWPALQPLDFALLAAEAELEFNSLAAPIETRSPAAAPKRKKGGTVNQRMLETMHHKHEAMNWSAQDWAHHLKCAKSTVVEAPAWRELQHIREKARSEAGERRRKQQQEPEEPDD